MSAPDPNREKRRHPLFSTIAAADWRRSLAVSRATPNSVAEAIRKKTAHLSHKPMNILLCIPTGETFTCFAVTETTFQIARAPLDFNITTRFTLDGHPIKITKQTTNAHHVSTFEYHRI